MEKLISGVDVYLASESIPLTFVQTRSIEQINKINSCRHYLVVSQEFV